MRVYQDRYDGNGRPTVTVLVSEGQTEDAANERAYCLNMIEPKFYAYVVPEAFVPADIRQVSGLTPAH